MGIDENVLTSGKTIQGDEYTVTTTHLLITIQGEVSMFEIADISHEGVIEWKEQEKFAFVFQFHRESNSLKTVEN